MDLRLRANFDAIVKDLEPGKYWNYLYQEGVLIDYDDLDEVKTHTTRKRQAEELLGKVLRSGPEKIHIFMEALNNTQPHLYALLQREIPGEQLPRRAQADLTQARIETAGITEAMTNLHVHTEQPPTFVRKALSPTEHGSDDPLGNTNKEAANNEAAEPSPDETPPFIIPTDLSKLPAHIRPESEEVYPMTSKPRGIALIINNESFVPSTEQTKKEQENEQLENRLGSEKDVQALQKLFEALDFKVKTERNIGRQKILEVLDEVCTDDHSAYDCFVLCLMSHGKEGIFYGADGESVPLETVCDFLSNSRCRTLRGKPKLIFIQACRGREKERGVVKDSPQSPAPITETSEEATDQGFNFSLPTIIPDHADILMAYSTVSGYASFRNPREGSRFVRCLVEVFQEKASHEDVLSMLTMVNDRISTMGEIDSKQVGQPTSTLTKKLFFWPGI